jgi:hypothetical protein
LQVGDSAIPTAEAASEDLHNVAASVGKVRQDQGMPVVCHCSITAVTNAVLS